MTRYTLSSDDLLVLRDGRPFGDAGMFGGTALAWPLPQTLAGMCRTALGCARSADYFSNADNIRHIMRIGLAAILPGIAGEHGQEFLIPTPADLVLTEKENNTQHQLYPLMYRDLGADEGTDLAAANWLYPMLNPDIRAKPAALPAFLRWSFVQAYLCGKIPANGTKFDLDSQAVTGPVREFRIHTAIDPMTYSVKEGQLYAESGIYLKAVGGKKDGLAGQKTRLADYENLFLGNMFLSFELEGIPEGEILPSDLYLGGERRRVEVKKGSASPFPPCPDCMDNQTLLKLVLITHGDFDSWVPSWLLPGGDPRFPDWVVEPVSGVSIRLRSAVVKGWDPVSGWDYATRKPKAMRKLVKPGSVYLIELNNPAESRTLANALWGRSICPPQSQAAKDGFGQVVIAKNTLQ